MSTKDGGPAFPHEDGQFGGANDAGSHGMSLRDYFAIHADQPGEAEIVAAAGLSMKAGYVECEDGEKRYFSQWYSHLSNEYRFSLYAKVRFAIADAMLAERAK
jgi:hypothetical protein